MPRAEAGSTKAIGNAIKAKGLTKLRFYCQVCSKACRDENGYRNHIASESHMRQIAVLGNNPGKAIDDMSNQFQGEFVSLLSRRFGTRRIKANQVYQEYIQERHHLHMNATRWTSLTEFVKHLGREGIVQVEDTEQGWFISWVDNSPAALARQDALQKMNRQRMDDEQRQRKFLAEQIERAKLAEGRGQDGPAASAQESQPIGLQRPVGEGPLKLGISLKSKGIHDTNVKTAAKAHIHSLTPICASTSRGDAPEATSSKASSSTSSSSSTSPLLQPNLKVPAALSHLKTTSSFQTRINPLKAAQSSQAQALAKDLKRPPKRSAAELIMAEEVERKQRMQALGPKPSAHKRSRF